MKGIKGTRWWEMRDLWPDHLRGALLCKPLGHRYTMQKMYDVLCCRCRACAPIRTPYTEDGKSYCGECNASLSRGHARGCRMRHIYP